MTTQDSFAPWPQADRPALSRRDLAAVVCKYLRPMLLILLAAVLGAVGYVFWVSPSYTAWCKILVKFGREHISALEMAQQPAGSVMISARVQDIFDEVEIMNDPSIMDSLVPELKTYLERPRPLPPPQSLMQWAKYYVKAAKRQLGEVWTTVVEAAKYPLYELGFLHRLTPEEKLRLQFKSALQIKDIKETDVILLGFAWPDPEFAAFAVNAYADAYRRQHLRVHGGGAGSVAFYEAQAERLGKELAQRERELDAFLAQAGINDLTGEKQATLNFIVELEAQQNQAAIERQEAEARLKHYAQPATEWPATPPLAGQEAAGLAALDNQFVQLVARRNQAREHYEPYARQVRDLDRQIAALREQKRLSLKAYYEDRVRSLGENAGRRQATLAEKRVGLEKLRALSLRYDTLQSQRSTLQTEYAGYRRKIEELRTTDALDAQDFASVSVISRAMPENALVSPRKGLIIGLAALFGLIFAVAYVLVAEFFNQTFRTEHDVVSVLGIPLMASLPESRHTLPESRRKEAATQ